MDSMPGHVLTIVCKRKDIALHWQGILSAEGTKSDFIGAEGKGASPVAQQVKNPTAMQ